MTRILTYMDTQVQSSTKLKKQGLGMIIGLTIQYLLGMITNIFVKFPENQQSDQLWEFARKQIPVVLHSIIGLLLLIGSLALLIQAIRYKNKRWTSTASIALIGVIAAGVGGAIFIPTQNNIYSFIMAVGFLVPLLAYIWGIYSSK